MKTENKSNQVVIKRVFKSKTDNVWKAWSDPNLVKKWYGGDPEGTVLNVDYDFKEGGKFRVHFANSDGSEFIAFGEFITIIPFKKIVQTFEWVNEPNHVTEVAVDFQDQGSDSSVTLTHMNLNPASEHLYQLGWNGSFNKIERII